MNRLTKEIYLSFLHLLAQASQPSTSAPWWVMDPKSLMLPLVIGVAALFLFTSSKNKRTEEKTRKGMLENLKRGDRVQTIGGVYGTVVDARPGDVVLKVDESSNTKIKFAREAIKRVVTDEETTK